MSAGQSVDERLAQVEMLLSHLQHDLDKLNTVMISQQSEMDEVKRLIGRVKADIDQLYLPEQTPHDEKPPHY